MVVGGVGRSTAAVCWNVEKRAIRTIKMIAAEMGVGVRPGQVVSMFFRIIELALGQFYNSCCNFLQLQHLELSRDPDKSLRESVEEATNPFLNLPPRILWAIGEHLFYAGQLCQKAAVERDPSLNRSEKEEGKP